MKVTQGNLTRVLKGLGLQQSRRIQVKENRRGSQRGEWQWSRGFEIENRVAQNRIFLVLFRAEWPHYFPPIHTERTEAETCLQEMQRRGFRADLVREGERLAVRVQAEAS